MNDTAHLKIEASEMLEKLRSLSTDGLSDERAALAEILKNTVAILTTLMVMAAQLEEIEGRMGR